MRQLIVQPAAIAAFALILTGCHCCPRPAPPPPGPVVPFPPGPPGAPVPPPGGFVPAPVPVPKGPAYIPGDLPPPAPPSMSKSSPPDMTWQPGGAPGVRLEPPVVTEDKQPGKGGVQLYPPIVSENDKPAPPPAPKVDSGVQPKAPSVFPVGIPQFAMAHDKVASGLRPGLEDGLDWLQANGYKTVLYIHEPGETFAADRKQVEKRGMRFVDLEVSPLALTPKLIEDFNRTVADVDFQPLFVYDRDGALAGSLWYLHFRTAEKAGDERAQEQARGLGLRTDRDGLHRDMWLAVQKYLSEQKN